MSANYSLFMELSKRFQDPGEKHDFWELVYIDKGTMKVFVDKHSNILEQGDIIFYAPDEFHAGHALNETAPNLIIISFECDSPEMSFFKGKTFRLDEEERMILSLLV